MFAHVPPPCVRAQGCPGIQLQLGRTRALPQLLPKRTGKDSLALGGKSQILGMSISPLDGAVKRLASPWLRSHPAILQNTEKFHFNW